MTRWRRGGVDELGVQWESNAIHGQEDPKEDTSVSQTLSTESSPLFFGGVNSGLILVLSPSPREAEGTWIRCKVGLAAWNNNHSCVVLGFICQTHKRQMLFRNHTFRRF